MSDQSPLPRFKAPVSEVAVGVQFQAPMLTPVHLGLYYQRVKARFPTAVVQAPLQPALERFGPGPTAQFPFPAVVGVPFQPRMWFVSADEASLIQLQSGRLFFNWRGGLQQNAYPHFDAVQAEFMKALDELETLSMSDGLGELVINQCEVIYVNPLPVLATCVPLSEPQRIFAYGVMRAARNGESLRRILASTFDTDSTMKMATHLVASQRHYRPVGHKMDHLPFTLR